MSLRVLLVGLNYAPEPIGIGPYTTALAAYLADAGHEVEVIAGRAYYPQWRADPGHRGWQWKRSAEQGVRIVRCPHYVPAVPTGVRRILHHLSFAAAALPVVVARCLRGRPDVVVCVTPSIVSAFTAAAGAWLGRSRLWVHVQDFEVEAAFATGLMRGGGRLGRLLGALERGLFRRADVVSSISPRMIERLHEKGVAPVRTYELRNWADPGFGCPAAGGSRYREEWRLGGRKVALYSGSIGRKQGARLIVEAARSLRDRDDIVFVICGEGPELEGLRASAAELDNVRFFGLQPAARMGELLALADIQLLPQIAAASDLVLPSKLTNMLLSGRPIVATTAAGSGLFAEIEGCGVAVPPGDAAALAAAVVSLADDPALAARLGAEAARRAEQRWSRRTILSAFDARLRELAAQRGDPASALPASHAHELG